MSPAAMGDAYASKLAIFCTEHLHSDEEIRFVLDGSGYFDVRDGADRWVRIATRKGDMIVLPEVRRRPPARACAGRAAGSRARAPAAAACGLD